MKWLGESLHTWREDFLQARGFRDRAHVLCMAALVVLEIVAVVWVVTSYRFESVVPVYQQF